MECFLRNILYDFYRIAETISEVIWLQYDNLKELISHSNSSRKFFLSLPVSMQLMLHNRSDDIHSAADLHAQVYVIEKCCWKYK